MPMPRREFLRGLMLGSGLWAWSATGLAGALAVCPRPCALLLTGTPLDPALSSGARQAARQFGARASLRVLRVDPLAQPAAATALLARHAGTRWLAVTDSARSVVFLELARTVSARFVVNEALEAPTSEADGRVAGYTLAAAALGAAPPAPVHEAFAPRRARFNSWIVDV